MGAMLSIVLVYIIYIRYEAVKVCISISLCWYTARSNYLWVQRCIGIALLYLTNILRHTLIVFAKRILIFATRLQCGNNQKEIGIYL